MHIRTYALCAVHIYVYAYMRMCGAGRGRDGGPSKDVGIGPFFWRIFQNGSSQMVYGMTLSNALCFKSTVGLPCDRGRGFLRVNGARIMRYERLSALLLYSTYIIMYIMYIYYIYIIYVYILYSLYSVHSTYSTYSTYST
jgi:hypothetical protein